MLSPREPRTWMVFGVCSLVAVLSAILIEPILRVTPSFPKDAPSKLLAIHMVDDGSMPLMERTWMTVRQSMPSHGEPDFIEASSVQLSEDTKVAAINIDGDARAYVLSNMERPDNHVLIHSVAGMAAPVCITYCNFFNCVRAFEVDATDDLDSIRIAGRSDKSMLLRVRGHVYSQDTGEARIANVPLFPLQQIPAAIMTWGEWLRENPEGLVFLGEYQPAPEKADVVTPITASTAG